MVVEIQEPQITIEEKRREGQEAWMNGLKH